MYNAHLIENFIVKVNKEAEEAAQKVYDKYQDQFKQLVSNQMNPGNRLYIGMGSASLTNKNGDTIADAFSTAVAQIQWTEQRAGFSLGDFTKEG